MSAAVVHNLDTVLAVWSAQLGKEAPSLQRIPAALRERIGRGGEKRRLICIVFAVLERLMSMMHVKSWTTGSLNFGKSGNIPMILYMQLCG